MVRIIYMFVYFIFIYVYFHLNFMHFYLTLPGLRIPVYIKKGLPLPAVILSL